MDAIVISWRELLVAIVLATFIYLLEVWLGSRRRRAGADKAARGEDIAVELARLREDVMAIRQRLDTLETRVGAAPSQTPEAETPYGRAVRLAREGLAAQELANCCGISRGEAELIVALHRPAP